MASEQKLTSQQKPTSRETPASSQKQISQEKPTSEQKLGYWQKFRAEQKLLAEQKLAIEQKLPSQQQPSSLQKPGYEQKPGPRQNPTPEQKPASGLLQEIQKLLPYTFHDPFLLWKALQTLQFGQDSICASARTATNKSLAAVGNAVLRLVLIEKWYSSGKPTEWDEALVMATKMHWVRASKAKDVILLVNSGVRDAGNTLNGHLLKSVIMAEAILGAVYLDGGMDAVQLVVGKEGWDIDAAIVAWDKVVESYRKAFATPGFD